jgi:hypothetical protein
VLPLAITTARRAMSRLTSDVNRAHVRQGPFARKSRAPVASIAAAGRLSSRSRAIHSTRLETFGKSTAHSTRDAARRRARSASVNVSPERAKVFEGTQPSTGTRHRPARARQPRATARCHEGLGDRFFRRPHHRDRRRRTPAALRKGCSPDAQVVHRPWYWCRPHHAEVRSIPSSYRSRVTRLV